MIIEVTTHVEVDDMALISRIVPGEIQTMAAIDKQTRYGFRGK